MASTQLISDPCFNLCMKFVAFFLLEPESFPTFNVTFLPRILRSHKHIKCIFCSQKKIYAKQPWTVTSPVEPRLIPAETAKKKVDYTPGNNRHSALYLAVTKGKGLSNWCTGEVSSTQHNKANTLKNYSICFKMLYTHANSLIKDPSYTIIHK